MSGQVAMSPRSSAPAPVVTAVLERRVLDLALAITEDGVVVPNVPPWRRVREAREVLVRAAFNSPEYSPAAGETRSVADWLGVWARLRADFRAKSARGSEFNSSRLLLKATQRGPRRFGMGATGGSSTREAEMKERGFFVIPLFEEGGEFALRLEEWCLRLFEEYDPEPVHGRSKQSYLTLCVGQAEADRLDAVLLEEDGLEMRAAVLEAVRQHTGHPPEMCTSFHAMVGDPSAHVGEVHGDHWGAPALAVTVAVGSGGTVSTAVVQAEGKFRLAGEAADGRPQMSRASYEDVKQARWEVAREAGLAGRLPPARIWSGGGRPAFALKVRTGVISPLRWGEPDPPRLVRGRPKLPQGSGFCFDATAPHLFPGVCSRGEDVRITLYVGYGAPVRLGGAAESGSVGWGNAAADEPAGDVRTAFDAKGEYRLRSAFSLSRTAEHRAPAQRRKQAEAIASLVSLSGSR